ncbi:MAG: DUF1043 family protein [Pseudomonadales bacterium]
MELLSNPWVAALFALFVGIAIGIFIHRSKYSDSSQSEKLKEEMQSLEQEFSDYKSSVAEHFDKTSELVQGLTENYVKVYQHLAEGSQALTNTDQMALKLGQDPDGLASVINKIEDSSSQPQSDENMQAPKDYAPKPSEDDTEGTLSEAFSIKKDKPAQVTEELVEPAEKPAKKLA